MIDPAYLTDSSAKVAGARARRRWHAPCDPRADPDPTEESCMRSRTLGWRLAAAASPCRGAARAADPRAAGPARRASRTLEQEVSLLRRKLEVQEEAPGRARRPQPLVGAGADGFFLRSADKKYDIRLRGYTQLRRALLHRARTTTFTDTFIFRRVRPIVEGTLGERRRLPDHAGLREQHARAAGRLHEPAVLPPGATCRPASSRRPSGSSGSSRPRR